MRQSWNLPAMLNRIAFFFVLPGRVYFDRLIHPYRYRLVEGWKLLQECQNSW